MSPIFQHELEQLLVRRLEGEEAAELRFSTELRSFALKANGVDAVVHGRQTGAETLVHARYMTAANGAKGMVRNPLRLRWREPTTSRKIC